jgi:hypothetical protein
LNDYFIDYEYKMNDYTKIISAIGIIFCIVVCTTYKETFIVEDANRTLSAKTLCNVKTSKLAFKEPVAPTSLDTIENVTNTQICPEPDCASGKGNPKYLYHPKTIKDVQTIIRAQKFGKTIKVSGSYVHKDISYTKDVIIRTLNLNKVLKTTTDTKTITIESGMLLKDIYEHLDQHALALSVILRNGWKSIGSAVCISDHGSNIEQGTICSLVKDITVILANGVVKTYTKDDREFKAIVGGIGGIAFIYSVTLQCVPAYDVNHSELTVSLKNVCANMNNYLDTHQYLEVDVNPYTKDCVLKLRKHVSKDALKDITSLVNTNISKSYKALSGKVESAQSTEIGIDYSHHPGAVAHVCDIINASNDKDVRICLRFSGTDQYSMLSMTVDRDLTCWIDVIGGCDELLKTVEEQLMSKFDGRPSYGTKNTLHDQRMITLYGNDFHEYQHVRNLLDSERIFTNDYLRERLGK